MKNLFRKFEREPENWREWERLGNYLIAAAAVAVLPGSILIAGLFLFRFAKWAPAVESFLHIVMPFMAIIGIVLVCAAVFVNMTSNRLYRFYLSLEKLHKHAVNYEFKDYEVEALFFGAIEWASGRRMSSAVVRRWIRALDYLSSRRRDLRDKLRNRLHEELNGD